MVGKDVGHWAVPVYSGNPLVAVALLRMIWAWGAGGCEGCPQIALGQGKTSRSVMGWWDGPVHFSSRLGNSRRDFRQMVALRLLALAGALRPASLDLRRQW